MWTIYFHGLRPKLTALSERRWQLRETPEEQSLSLTDTVLGSFGPKISTTKKWEKMPFHQLTDMLCLDVKQGCVANILAKVIISRLQECLSQTKHRLPRMILSFVSGSVSNTKDWFYWLLERNQSRISSELEWALSGTILLLVIGTSFVEIANVRNQIIENLDVPIFS